jgi:hypothetical protein
MSFFSELRRRNVTRVAIGYIADKAIWAPWFATVPHFSAARSDPRFAELVAKLNLP